MFPTNNRMLVRPDERNKLSAGGIHLVHLKENEPESGVIIEPCRNPKTKKGIPIKSELKQGDHILFNKYRALPYRESGEDFVFVNIDDVMGILTHNTEK